jgi:hypothetical protein
MLERVKKFQEECGIPLEMLAKLLQWPSWAIDNLQDVVDFMKRFEDRIVEVEKLCEKTLQTNQINVEIVNNCVTQTIFIAKQFHNERRYETRSTQALNVFPVDDIDIHRLMRRGTNAVAPLLDKLYEKALQSHAMISDPSITKFDLNFRLQNSQRLLRMCCQMSDNLSTYFDLQKHPKYSEAMLKVNDLEQQYKKQLSVLERKGDWDKEEEVELEPSYGKRSLSVSKDTALIREVVELLSKGQGIDKLQEIVSNQELDIDLYLRAEIQLIKAAITSCSSQIIDVVIGVRDQLISDEEQRHRHDFDWLNEAVIKNSQDCLKHLIQVVGIPINCQSSDLGNCALHVAARRQDWSMTSLLVRLGADSTIENNSYRNPLQLLAIKCFPIRQFPEIESRVFPIDLSSYINNPNLSDGQIVTNEGETFHVHRLMLCGQSPVFKSMLESEHWTVDREEGNKITLPTVAGKTMKLLLQYLYTGDVRFNSDDLDAWIELLAAADQFLLEPLRLQCERVLSSKIDEEVVVPMLRVAATYGANKLLANCCNYLLSNCSKVDDPNNETLLYVLDNAETFISKV